jgi:hypothetical protein
VLKKATILTAFVLVLLLTLTGSRYFTSYVMAMYETSPEQIEQTNYEQINE